MKKIIDLFKCVNKIDLDNNINSLLKKYSNNIHENLDTYFVLKKLLKKDIYSFDC